jgi:hypothetical protein
MLVDSKQQQLKPQEILKTALEETESPHDLPYAVASITREIQAPETIYFLIGNTLFIVNKSPSDKKHAFFRALNADVAANYLENSKEFVRRMKDSGFTVVVTRFKDSTLVNLFKAISKNPPFPNMGYVVQRLKSGGYQATINMGEV